METTPKEKIQKIIDELGVSTEVQAKAMKISVKTVYNKMNDNIQDHSFNEKNYQDLIGYIKEKVEIL